MGILLAALAAAGDSGVDSINQNIKQQNQMDLETQRMDLETQKAKTLEDYKNQANVSLTNTQRDALTARLAPTQDQMQGIIAQNAQRYNDYTTEGDQTPATYGQLQDEDQTNQKYQPSMKQMVEMQIVNANKSGDFVTAAELTKQLDAGKVSAGYGAKIVDQNDLDENGDPRLIIDNSGDRAEAARANSAARQTNANANAARAARPVAARTGLDSITTSQKVQMASKTSQLNGLRRALDGASKTERPAIQASIDSLSQSIDSLNGEMEAHRKDLAAKVPTAAAAPTGDAAPSGTDYSKLWGN